MSDSTLHPAHPEVELLAEHAEELLTPEQSAELTAHLASCAECRESYAALVELSTLLGDEPAPGPMPADVAARIDAALAAEREGGPEHERAHAPLTVESLAVESLDAPAVDDEDGVGSEKPESGTDRPRSVSRSASDPNPTPGSGSGSKRRPAGDRPADKRPASRSPRSARVRRVLATLALFVAAGGIGVAVSRGGDLDSSGGARSSAAGAASATAPSPKALAAPAYNFTQTNLTSEVQRLASDAARLHLSGRTAGTVPSTSASPDATPSGPPSATHSPSGVGALVTPNGGPENPASSTAQPTAPACVLAATKQTQPPAVQGLGSYLDVEVFALLYPDPADPAHTWDVYLVQNSCSAPLVMLHASVPRG